MRKGHSKISQEDIVDVLDKQLLEGMGVLLTEEEQEMRRKCKSVGIGFIFYSVCAYESHAVLFWSLDLHNL